jgi:spore maturation protein CgeB
MRICVLGKRGSMIGWVDGAVAAWRKAGHDVLHAIFRDARLAPKLEAALFSETLGAPRARAIVRRVRAFAPELMVAVDAFSTPLSLLARLAATPGLPSLVGWVGDRFGDYARDRAPFFAAIGYTDSGLVELHTGMQLKSGAFYLPHAANALLADASAPKLSRRSELVFVAAPTPQRVATLLALQERVVLYGAGWHDFPGSQHELHASRVPLEGLAPIYRGHLAVLNMRNETHVLAGLNQRNFDPFLCGAVVATDRQPDLERCFTPCEEVLVWQAPADIDALSARLRRDPAWACRIAEAGRRRVLAEHTYGARLKSFVRLSR